jgi:hypothetical protein
MTTNPHTNGLDMDAIHHRAHLGRTATPLTQRVLQAVRACPRGTSTDALVQQLRLPVKTVSKTLCNLSALGHIVNASAVKKALWVCKKNPLLAHLKAEADQAKLEKRIASGKRKDEAAAIRSRLMGTPNGGEDMSGTKSPERIAVEDCLAVAGSHGRTRAQVMRHTGLDEETVKTVLQNLVSKQKADSLLRTNNRHWRLLSAVARDEKQERAMPVRNSTTTGNYVPLELRAFDGRPGAMDAFALPSLVGNELVQPRGIKAGCTGAAPSTPAFYGAPRMAK